MPKFSALQRMQVRIFVYLLPVPPYVLRGSSPTVIPTVARVPAGRGGFKLATAPHTPQLSQGGIRTHGLQWS